MPGKPWPIWLLTFLILLGYPAVSAINFPALLQSGALPPDGDSIGIPILVNLFVTIILAPFILLGTWLCLRRYRPHSRLLAWRSDRLVRSVSATLTLGGAAAYFGWGAFDLYVPDAPWFEYLWVAYFALWPPWLLALRAAIVSAHDPGEEERENASQGR